LIDVKVCNRTPRYVATMPQEGAMSISSIAVHVDSDPQARARVELAYRLARQFNAHLTGLGAVMSRLPSDPAGFSLSPTILARAEERTRGLLADAEACFRSVVLPTDSTDWRGVIDYPAEHIARQARSADILVIGHGTDRDEYLFAEPGEVIIRSARPILIVPRGLKEYPLDTRAVVAWKDTREARRSVADAIPLLCRASSVSIIGVCGEDEHESDPAGLMDVATFLRRHGVNVDTARAEPVEGDVADILLTLARQQDAGLIVLGAYGHSRLAEWVFGGVTEAVLRNAHLCCLMSH
jgi:nucleotide-binding universal stress UspA family protein